MFLLVRTDGSVEPLPGVASIENDGKELLCRDGTGTIVHRYTPREVLLYGEEVRILPLLEEHRDPEARVQKLILDGSQQSCAALSCGDTAAVSFRFESPQGELKLGLCQGHQSLIDEQARTIVLNELDLHRLTVFQGSPSNSA